MQSLAVQVVHEYCYFFPSKDLDSNTILQIGHVSKCPFRSLVHKLAQVLLHHHTVENRRFYWSLEVETT